MALDLERCDALPPAIIVDIDGTVAVIGKRSPYDADKAYLDTPNRPVVEVVKAMWTFGYVVIFCSGRMEKYRQVTESWLAKHVPVDYEVLLMRQDSDTRRDSIVKREIYENKILGKYDVLLTIDDRKQVVQECWRELGLTCLQCAEGDY